MNGLGFVLLSPLRMIASIAVIIKIYMVMAIEFAVYIIALIKSAICKYGKIV